MQVFCLFLVFFFRGAFCFSEILSEWSGGGSSETERRSLCRPGQGGPGGDNGFGALPGKALRPLGRSVTVWNLSYLVSWKSSASRELFPVGSPELEDSSCRHPNSISLSTVEPPTPRPAFPAEPTSQCPPPYGLILLRLPCKHSCLPNCCLFFIWLNFKVI